MGTPYPSVMPIESVSNIIRIVREGTITAEVKDFANDIWTTQGYIQSVVIGNPLPVINGQPPSPEFAAQCKELVGLLEDIELPAVGAGPVGSDLSVFIRNISLIGFVAALKQFLLDIFNIKV